MQGENSVSPAQELLGLVSTTMTRRRLRGKKGVGLGTLASPAPEKRGPSWEKGVQLWLLGKKAPLTNCLRTSQGTRCPKKMAELGLYPRTREGREEERDNFHFKQVFLDKF